MSRDTALTEDVSRGILAAIRAGNDNVVAAGAQRINEATLYRWLERGADDAVCVKRYAPSAAHPAGKVDWRACTEGDHEPGACPGNERYRLFRKATDQARFEFEVMMSGHVAKAAPTNPRYALALLERRVPHRWRPGRPILPSDIAPHVCVPIVIEIHEENRPDAEVKALTAALDATPSPGDSGQSGGTNPGTRSNASPRDPSI